jgi:hypothetical protein
MSYTPLPRLTTIPLETLVTLFLDGGSCLTDGTRSQALELCLRLPRYKVDWPSEFPHNTTSLCYSYLFEACRVYTL